MGSSFTHGLICFNYSSGISPLEAVTDVRSCLLIDVVPFSIKVKLSVKVDDFIKDMQQIYDEVQSHIAASNDSDKNHANKHCHFIEFSEGVMVIICIHPEQLPLGANEKLHTRNASTFKVLKKLSSNGYAL